MKIAILLQIAIGLLAFESSPVEASTGGEAAYGASVTFESGQCWFWTGDVGLTAKEFRKDLAIRFDPRRGIIITHIADTPPRCIRLAIRSAKNAGFSTAKAIASNDAGPIPPPGS